MEDIILHIEICQSADSTLRKTVIERAVFQEFFGKIIQLETVVYGKDCEHLCDHVDTVICYEENLLKEPIEIQDASIVKYYIYRLTQEGAATEIMKSDSDELSVASHWLLPTQEFHNLWDNLYYDGDVKDKSGKLVMKLFDEIRNMVQNEKALICILIDEVESLAHARNLCTNGNEPSDSIRVVNALLTQLDQIKRYPNVLILTTSNMTEVIDLAFVDRADIKQYLGNPCVKAIYSIYRSCLNELMKTDLLEEKDIYDIPEIDKDKGMLEYRMSPRHVSTKLLKISEMSEGLSGRTLRKIPFLAYALYLPRLSTSKIALDEFLPAMRTAVIKQKEESRLQQS
ncbi:pachytene checkpoint protein 2 homolog isoform X2 [Ooceraea biroi]|uniref:pachytene checkpoint protein 2 homolog isoform X2 n=1 Tax=Ooceraea biroi TaxID=2015173 RepID=UPI0005BBF993|nr:pachytene checkpoint protein 2 homolog isoform X2 [Ooceraea biroi]